MVDTLDSGSSAGNGVEVRLLSRAPWHGSPKGEFCMLELQYLVTEKCL
jgi:hypothetical protein